jgi:hypothetical protein
LNKIILIAFLGGLLILQGCAIHMTKATTGKPILQSDVDKIKRGETAGGDILGMFGAPTMISKMGGDELYIYKRCKTSGGGIAVPFIGGTSTDQICNELTITLNKDSKVKDFSYKKVFEE